jgi:novel plant SNARE
MSWPKTEQEEKLDEIYNELDSGFRKLDKLKDPAKSNAILKDLTNKLKDAKTYATDSAVQQLASSVLCAATQARR